MKLSRAILSLTLLAILSTFALCQGSTLKELAKMEKDQKSAKAAYLKSKNNVKVKKKYVAATVKLGTASMESEALDRKVKYAKALRLYREALKADPNNAEAKNNKQLIEDIYRSMHRPIPN